MIGRIYRYIYGKQVKKSGDGEGHLLPSGLVVGVVDLDDVLHVLLGQGALLKLPALKKRI